MKKNVFFVSTKSAPEADLKIYKQAMLAYMLANADAKGDGEKRKEVEKKALKEGFEVIS